MKQDLVYVIVVTYNAEKWVDYCIGSLVNSESDLHIIVVDNNSFDTTKAQIREKYPQVILLELMENRGFGRANNIGIKYALNMNADYIFLLNQDACINKFTLEEVVKVASTNPEYGIISPVHLNGDASALDYNFSLQVSPRNCENFYSDIFVGIRRDIYRAKFVNAAAWLVTRKCIDQVGYFDPPFFSVR